jgi:hypothetical protein
MKATTALALVLLVVGCGGGAQVAGPSSVEPAGPRVVAVMVKEGVLLRAERLQGAQQVEGVIEWVPTSLWYESFDQGQWWFSAEEWEWVMVPREGGVSWGVWRGEGVSGGGVLGLIRFEDMPSVRSVRVWVDGRPVEASAEHRGGERGETTEGLVATAGALGGAKGEGAPKWFLGGLAGGQ